MPEIDATTLFGVTIAAIAVLACLAAFLSGNSSDRSTVSSDISRARKVQGREMPVPSFVDISENNPVYSGKALTADAEVITAAQLTSKSVGTTLTSLALDTADLDLDPACKSLNLHRTELEEIRRPASISDLFAVSAESTRQDERRLQDIRRQVLRAYRQKGLGACLVIPISGQQGAFFDLRLERYSDHLASICEEMFDILCDLADWSESADKSGAPKSFQKLPQSVPLMLRELKAAIRELSLPPAYDYLRAEIDAYAGAVNGRLQKRTILGVINRYGRLDMDGQQLLNVTDASSKLLSLITLIAAWDVLILNFGFSKRIQ